MSLRRSIIRELAQFQREYPNSWLGARDMSAWRRDPAGFAGVMIALLTEELVLTDARGERDAEREKYRLNPERLADIRGEIVSPRRFVFALLAALVAAGVTVLLVLRG
jgi:glycine/D-amino acid oxidase-like deaminating enzyme